MRGETIRCLIVDDEALAIESIRSLARRDPVLEVVGEAMDGAEAVSSVQRLHPDLLFLDIQMTEMGGFEVLAELRSRGITLPVTIFVTAFDRYALRAFEAHAFDYLLKPVSEKRFREAVSAAKARMTADRIWPSVEQLSLILKGNDGGRQWPERIAVRTGVRMTFLRVCTIEWLQSEGNYVRLFANGSAQLVRGTMNGIQDKLDPGQFLRIHRSAIVNIDFIKELRARRTGDYTVRMLGGKEFTLTRTYRSSLARLLEAVPPA